VKTLLTLADVWRRGGAHALAARALAAALEREPSGPEALLAAFTLGKLELDVLGQPAQAALHFERVARAGATSALGEDALARLVEALLRADAREQARERAREYLRRFASGRWAAKMERVLNEAP
jgi:transmembrane sensor